MKVYTFTSQKMPVAKNHKNFFSSSRSASVFKRNKSSFFSSGLNIFSFLDDKFVSQVVAILFLTVAVFVSVQGLFSSTSSTTARAANNNDEARLIINYNTKTTSSREYADASKLVDSPDVVSPGTSNLNSAEANIVKVENVSSSNAKLLSLAGKN